MKARDLRTLGFEAVIGKDGESAWVLPMVKVDAVMAQDLTIPQVCVAVEKGIERAKRGIEKLLPKPAAAPKAEPKPAPAPSVPA